MRCEICNAITEHCSFDKVTSKMSNLCDKCNAIINETIGEDQQDDEEKTVEHETDWFRL